jgi:hypothetical protein
MKLRAMFSVLDQMKSADELKVWRLWKVHTLTGDRKEPGAFRSRGTGG